MLIGRMANPRVPATYVAKAIAKAGDHIALAKHLRVTYQAVNYWRKNGAPFWRLHQLTEYMLAKPARRGGIVK